MRDEMAVLSFSGALISELRQVRKLLLKYFKAIVYKTYNT
jgi:hypothetical protein